MDDEKSARLYRLLEEATERVKQWPDWKRSEEAKRELERLAAEAHEDQVEGVPDR